MPSSTGTALLQDSYNCYQLRHSSLRTRINSSRQCPANSSLEDFYASTELISTVPGFILDTAFECTVTNNEDGSVLIECPALQVYSSGETRSEAIENLQENIACLFDDLNSCDDFSEEWLEIKKHLLSHMSKA